MAVAAEAGLDVDPSLERARELAREGNAIPVRMSFVDDCETPGLRLPEAPATAGPCFLLESAEQGRLGRYSFLGFSPRRCCAGPTACSASGPASACRRAGGAPDAPDPYAAVSEYLGRYRLPPVDDLPPFAGGAVGFFGYDLVRTVEPLGEPNPDPLGLPDMALMVSDAPRRLRPHASRADPARLRVPRREADVDAAYARAVSAIADARERLRGPVPRHARDPRIADAEGPEFTSNMTREEFEANVRRIIEYVHAGDAFQVVPSQRFSAPSRPSRRSRSTAACGRSTPRRTCTSSTSATSSSPAPRPSRWSRSPGAGSRRARSPAPIREGRARRRTAAAPRSCSRDPKERAEHVMLVDLGRNDLGRVCEYGSVQVDELMVVEAYSHVLHIVSQVSGRLRAEVTAMDALRAVLPAGTLSGAPKVRAMQIIDELEPHKRGSYGGAIGYLGLHRRPRHGDPHPHGGGEGRPGPRPGRRRHRRRRQARLRVRGDASTRRRPSSARSSWRRASRSGHESVLVIDNYDCFTYNLVQYLGELGAEPDVVRNDGARSPSCWSARPDRLVISPGPCTPRDAGISIEAARAFPEAGVPDARRLPGPPVAGRGVRRPHDPRRADPRQGRRDRARRRGRPSRAREPAARRPLPLAGRRSGAARRARADARASTRW